MSARLREHLRSNIVGYIALFCFAMSGTAVALDGSNTVFSDDIVNNGVRSEDVRDDTLSNGGLGAVDLAPNSVGVSEVAPSSVTGADIIDGAIGPDDLTSNSVRSEHIRLDAVGSAEIASGAVGSGEIATETINTTDIATDAVRSSDIAQDAVDDSEIVAGGVGSSEVADFSLTNQDISVFYALVDGNSSILGSSGGVSVRRAAETSHYWVDFGRSVRGCGAVATPLGALERASADGRNTSDSKEVLVTITDKGGGILSGSDLNFADFSLVVVC
jgi:hypothetical protein